MCTVLLPPGVNPIAVNKICQYLYFPICTVLSSNCSTFISRSYFLSGSTFFLSTFLYLFTHLAFLFLLIFFYRSFPFFSFLTRTCSCYFSRPLLSSSLFSSIKFRLLFLHFLCPFYAYLVPPGFLFLLCPAVCDRQLSFQGLLATYFCPC
jgi:hypothetical protein